MSATDDTYWTIAYRRPRANYFHRATDLATTWDKASELGRTIAQAHPELEVWTTTTAESERAGWTHGEDVGNILTNSGRRVRVVDNGSIESLGVTP